MKLINRIKDAYEENPDTIWLVIDGVIITSVFTYSAYIIGKYVGGVQCGQYLDDICAKVAPEEYKAMCKALSEKVIQFTVK